MSKNYKAGTPAVPHLYLSCQNIVEVIDTVEPWENITLELRYALIIEALKQNQYNQTKAAKVLGMNRGTFRKHLKAGEAKKKRHLYLSTFNISEIVACGLEDIEKTAVLELRKEMINAALIRFFGNQTSAAKLLCCDRSLIRKYPKQGIKT